MNENGQLTLAKLINFQTAVIVKLELLNIRMKLNAFQSKLFEVADIARNVLAFGVERSETGHFSAAFGNNRSNVFVDRLHLLRCCCNGKNNRVADMTDFVKTSER